MGIVGCRSVDTADELRRSELRLQELVAENERLRRNLRAGVLPPLPLPAEPGARAGPSSGEGGQDLTSYFLVPEPVPEPVPSLPRGGGGAGPGARGEAGCMLPALAPEDLEAMIAAAPKEAAPKEQRGPAVRRKAAGRAAARQQAAEQQEGGKGQEAVQAVRGAAADRLPGLPAHAPVLLRLGRLPGSGKDQGLGPERQRAFLREVQVLSAICHEHLVPLLAFCMPCLGLVHPWPELGNLGQLLREAPPEPSDGFRALAGAARGLAALHEMRLVHRDVKSAGVYLYSSPEGDGALAKLGDCGLVCEPDDSGDGPVGVVVGTPPYTDPLHLLSGRFFKASDVFSLGVVLLEVLLGRSAAQLAEPGAPCERQLGAAAGRAAAALVDDAMATRRPRAPPLWLQFDQQLPKGSDAAGAAVELVLSARPRPDWSKRALLAATSLLLEMLKVDWAEKDGLDSPPGRPTAAAAVEELEVACALQASGATPVAQARRERLCVVCMDERIDTQLTPCRHSALCQACAAVFVGREEPCPICRRKVTGFDEGDFLCTFVQ